MSKTVSKDETCLMYLYEKFLSWFKANLKEVLSTGLDIRKFIYDVEFDGVMNDLEWEAWVSGIIKRKHSKFSCHNKEPICKEIVRYLFINSKSKKLKW